MSDQVSGEYFQGEFNLIRMFVYKKVRSDFNLQMVQSKIESWLF